MTSMMGKRLILIGLMIGVACACPAFAVDRIVVIGLFKDRAVVEIDGKRRVLSTGQTSPEGVKLVGADSEAAVLDFDGRRERYGLGLHVGTGFTAPDQPQVMIYRDPGGMYRTIGSINGMPVNFMVDTGATMVAMNGSLARRLGIAFRVDGKRSVVRTASGTEQAYGVKLDSVRVGDITLRNVEALVLDGREPDPALLGMSFLGRLELRNDGDALVLRKKF